MARSIRVEAYLPHSMLDQMDEATDNRSEFIREAVAEKLERENAE